MTGYWEQSPQAIVPSENGTRRETPERYTAEDSVTILSWVSISGFKAEQREAKNMLG